MTSSQISNIVLQPPRPSMDTNSSEFFSLIYELWNRSGGYESSNPDLKGLKASVSELNTLVGVRTDDTVQDQLDTKANQADLGTMADQDADNVAITGGSIEDVTISNSNVTIRAGGSVVDIPLGGTLTVDTTSVGNVGAGEDTLITYSMAANTLNLDGNFLEIFAWGITAANANNKTIKLKFGTTTLLDTGAVAANNANWSITSKIIRTAAATQQVISSIISDNSLIIDSSTFTASTEDLTTSLSILCTGEATTNDDIIQKGLIVKWFK